MTLKSKYFHFLSHPTDPSKGNFLTKTTTDTKINAVHIDDVRTSQSYCHVGFLQILSGKQGLPVSSPTHLCTNSVIHFFFKGKINLVIELSTEQKYVKLKFSSH